MTGLAAAGETSVLAALTAGVYVSLHTADPGPTGSSELSGNNYARQGAVSFSNAGSNPTVASNSAAIVYVAAAASWGTVTHFGVWTALTGGSFKGSGALGTATAIASGASARFPIAALTITVD